MKVVITGATGMLGHAVLIECLQSPWVKSVLIINRKPLQHRNIDMSHPKLTEVVHHDFTDFSALSTVLTGYDACFFCLGVSAFGMSETQFSDITYGITLAFATQFKQVSPNAVFNYVSGQGCDSSEQGKVMWARVKGRVENRILDMGFKDAYAFRPGAIYPVKGVKSNTRLYSVAYTCLKPIYPIAKRICAIIESDQFGVAMINSVRYPQPNKHLENKELIKLASLDL